MLEHLSATVTGVTVGWQPITPEQVADSPKLTAVHDVLRMTPASVMVRVTYTDGSYTEYRRPQ